MAAGTVLRIAKSQAVALFVAMGLKTAKKWPLKKLTAKLNEIDTGPDEPFDDEDLETLMDQLLESEEAVVVEDDELEDEADDLDEVEGEEEEEEEQEEEEEEEKEEQEEEPAPKGKKGKKGKKEKTQKGKAKAKGGARENSIDSVTLELLRGKPMKLDVLVARLAKEFPTRDREVLERTTKRRLTGYLQNKLGVKIEKSDKGVYSVK